jgi:hypothetical protein
MFVDGNDERVSRVYHTLDLDGKGPVNNTERYTVPPEALCHNNGRRVGDIAIGQ